MVNKLRVGSLFCGAGGFDLGFSELGHQIEWAIDNDADCIDTYKANIGNHAILADVGQVDFKKLRKVDLIIGGFPCQGFSIANSFRSEGDERNQLYKAFVRSVRTLKPKYFLAENVRGLLSLGKGEVISRIVNEFASEGYRVDYRLFNAADFEVPQNRFRVFIWGIRNDLDVEHFWPIPVTAEKKISVSQALKNIPEPGLDSSLKNHVGSKYKVTNKNFVGCRKLDPDLPCPTIIARGNGGGGVNAIPHPLNHRRMTVREQALIQTFPIDFEFKGSMSSCYRQVGNAVPVKLAEQFGKIFLKKEYIQ